MKWPAAVMLPPEPDALLDRFASLAARTLGTPMAVLSLLDDEQHVVLPGASGMPDPWQQERTMGWAQSLCRFVTTGSGLVAVGDTATDPRAGEYADAVDAFGVASWIAAPVRFSTDFTRLFENTDRTNRDSREPVGSTTSAERSPDQLAVLDDVSVVLELDEIHDIGRALEGGDGAAPAGTDGVVWGVLCAMDTVPRRWDGRDRELIEDLAAAAAAELRSRVLTSRAIDAERRMATTLATAEAVQSRSKLLLGLSRGLAQAETVDDVSEILTRLLREQLGVSHFGLLLHEAEHHRARYVDMSTFPPGTDPAWASFDLRRSSAPAARAVTERRPFFCDDRDAVHALDPNLADQGAWEFPGAVVIVPLLTRSSRVDQASLGALVLVWHSPRDTSDTADRDLWTALADYTAQTLARVTYTSERRSSAETLQRSMLTALPQPDHLELRARYVPAATNEQVGGDWYDAVVQPDGTTAVVIGDVTGHDVAAAARMGQLRGLLRAFVFDREEPPAAVVTRLDKAVAGLDVDALATLVVAHVEQTEADARTGTRRIRWSNAGHPPPVLLLADGSTLVLDTTPELLVGLVTDADRTDHVHVLPPNSTLLLYTDGLIEHRSRSLTEGIDDLRRVLAEGRNLSVEELLGHLETELIGDSPDDDCALLAVRAHPEDRPRPAEAGPNVDPRHVPILSGGQEGRPGDEAGPTLVHRGALTLEPHAAAVGRARTFVHDLACRVAEHDDQCGDYCDTLTLLVSEVVTNAFLHGRSQARLQVLTSGRSVRIEVADDNSRLPTTIEADPEALGGNGLRLVDALATAWGVRRENVGKTVWFELHDTPSLGS